MVIADDDVRYDEVALERTVAALDEVELVRPQNYFAPLTWHARWDTARTLLNRVAGGVDFPGTLAVRRSALRGTDGYDGDVLFENLELIRTIEAAGGACSARPTSTSGACLRDRATSGRSGAVRRTTSSPDHGVSARISRSCRWRHGLSPDADGGGSFSPP